MGKVNEDVVRFPAADQTARTPSAVIPAAVNAGSVIPQSDGIQFLKGTPAGAAHVSLRDESGAPYGATKEIWDLNADPYGLSSLWDIGG